MSKLFEYMKRTYEKDEPIFLSDLKFQNCSETSIRKALERLVKKDQLKRFSSGVYYMPIQTILGKKELSPSSVIDAKLIKSKKQIYGFYAGLGYANEIGITTQVPNVIEIVSNKESSAKREVKYGYQKLIVRKSPIVINQKNIEIVRFLDFIRYSKNELIENNKDNLINYIKGRHMKKKQVDAVLNKLPIKVTNKLKRNGLSDVFA